VFQHAGKKRTPAPIDGRSALPSIQSVKPTDLALLAADTYDYGRLETLGEVQAAMVVYAGRHRKVEDAVPLDQVKIGHVTVWDSDEFAQEEVDVPVRVTFQLDWFQGKHDQPFMRANSEADPRDMDGTQMRRGLGQYATLAQGVPAALTSARMAQIFARPENTAYDFAVMGTMQSDGLYYEISAMWATAGPGRHVLVYYHCYPDRKNERKWR
jgi:hypothetical protein